MNIKFDSNNIVIKLCIKGMSLDDSGNIEYAITTFHEAGHEVADDYERFIAAYHLARQQNSIPDELKCMETSLQYAININDDTMG